MSILFVLINSSCNFTEIYSGKVHLRLYKTLILLHLSTYLYPYNQGGKFIKKSENRGRKQVPPELFSLLKEAMQFRKYFNTKS